MRLVALAVGAMLVLAGCGTDSTTTTETPRGTNTPTAEETSETTTEATATEEVATEEATTDAGSQVGAWGDTRTWDDGLSITVSAPTPFEPSDTSSLFETEYPAYLSFDITVVNNTGAPYDPSMIYITMQSANSEAEEIFDSEQDYNGSPMTTLLDGRESQFKVGFGVQDPDDIVMELTPGFEYDAGLWSS